MADSLPPNVVAEMARQRAEEAMKEAGLLRAGLMALAERVDALEQKRGPGRPPKTYG